MSGLYHLTRMHMLHADGTEGISYKRYSVNSCRDGEFN